MASDEGWAKIRAKGKWMYMLKNGVLGFGIPFGLVYGYFRGQKSGDVQESIIEALFIGVLIAGPLYGWLQWNKNEKKFRPEKRNTTNS